MPGYGAKRKNPPWNLLTVFLPNLWHTQCIKCVILQRVQKSTTEREKNSEEAKETKRDRPWWRFSEKCLTVEQQRNMAAANRRGCSIILGHQNVTFISDVVASWDCIAVSLLDIIQHTCHDSENKPYYQTTKLTQECNLGWIFLLTATTLYEDYIGGETGKGSEAYCDGKRS